MINLFIPKKCEYMILENTKKKIIYIYNKNFYLKLKIQKKDIKLAVDNSTKSICVTNKKILGKNGLITNYINNLIFSWNSFYFEKLKFTGKGYKIKKSEKKNSITLLFNRAHPTIVFTKKILIKKIKKTKLIILGTNINTLSKIQKKIVNVRNLNIYTKRGLRNCRSLIFKKSSKKTAAI